MGEALHTATTLTTPLQSCRRRRCCLFGQWQFWWSPGRTPCLSPRSSSCRTVGRGQTEPQGRPPRPTHTAHSHGQQPGPRTLTLASAGLVENLSRRSPCSSYSSTTRSAVHTAKRPLLADQAMQVTRAVPSCGTHTQPQRPDSPRFPPAPPDPKRPDSTRPAGTAGSSRAAAASCGTESGSSTRSHRRRTPLQPTPVA